MHERARDDELLTHAVAVALHELVAPLLEIEEREQLAGTMLHLEPALIVQAGDKPKELRARELLVDEGPIGDEAELRFRRARVNDDVDARDLDAPRGRPQYAGDHPEGCRLPGAVRPEEAEELTARHGEIDAVDGSEGTVTLGERCKADHLRC